MIKSCIHSVIQRNFVYSTKFVSARIIARRTMSGETNGVALKRVIDKLKGFAPTSLAESWDNVGLLVEPLDDVPISHILLTNDLTEDVMDEALAVKANLIISYHPPLFAPLKKITNSSWKERIIAKCIANNIALFSPHTSWDIVEGGVTDWLASAFDSRRVKTLNTRQQEAPKTYILNFTSFLGSDFVDTLRSEFSEKEFKILDQKEQVKFTIQCCEKVIQTLTSEDYRKLNCITNFYATPEYIVPGSVEGIGRLCTLKDPITVAEAVEKLKKHIGMPFVQLALARGVKLGDSIETIAFVCGSGGSLLKNVHCDLKVTGEASHHEVLDCVHNGSSVILTNHSNSERGFLHQFKQILATKLNNSNVKISVSETDSDPLNVI